MANIKNELARIADPKNWGYFDDSGCPKGRGDYRESWVGDDPHPIDTAKEIAEELTELRELRSRAWYAYKDSATAEDNEIKTVDDADSYYGGILSWIVGADADEQKPPPKDNPQ